MSVDVEDYFMVEAFADRIDIHSWDRYPTRVAENTRRILRLLEEGATFGTFFTVGWVAERFPELIKEIHDAGHELACHSYWHRAIYKLTPEEFRRDTLRAKDIIEQIIGQPIYGYRAPSWSVTEKSFWAIEILAELGFTYDSSVFPIYHDLYGLPGAGRFPYRHSCSVGQLLEFPPSTVRVAGMTFPAAGGGYLRILPMAFTKFAFDRIIEHERQFVVVYLHPWEVDPEQPRLPGRLKSRLRHYTNLAKMAPRVAELMRLYEFESFQQRFARLEGDKVIAGN
jgi:polysaccharide deacetylase family protein (PEP-CTERM system associated)